MYPEKSLRPFDLDLELILPPLSLLVLSLQKYILNKGPMNLKNNLLPSFLPSCVQCLFAEFSFNVI
jgi:hypothetical protein